MRYARGIMRTFRLCTLALLLSGCATSAPPPPAHEAAANEAVPDKSAAPAPESTAPVPDATPIAAHDEKWKSRAQDQSCASGLSALAAGRLETFRGVQRCGRVDAEAVFGSSGDQ